LSSDISSTLYRKSYAQEVHIMVKADHQQDEARPK